MTATSASRRVVSLDASEASSLPHPSTGSLVKRIGDLVVAAIAVIVSAPLFLLIAVAIRFSSKGPVLFRQERVGLGGRPFTMLKFRTMRPNSDAQVHRQYVLSMIRTTPAGASQNGAFKLNADARVTEVGAFLRKSSLDELPQFINVLRGEMSIVGPRPPLAYEVAEYEPWQMARLAARPGITGLWQVSGRNQMSYVDMCRRDVEYMQTWSLLLDLKIMCRTPWVMLVNSGRAS